MADALLDNFEQEKVIPQILQYDHEKELMAKMAQVLKEQKPITIQSVTMSNGIHV
jgi:tRNA U34 5-carboxymethylaminomethyl modifying enzyme MnmG/GidA